MDSVGESLICFQLRTMINVTVIDDRGERDTRTTRIINDFEWNKWLEFSNMGVAIHQSEPVEF